MGDDLQKITAKEEDEGELPPIFWQTITILTWSGYMLSIFLIGKWAEANNIIPLPGKLQVLIFTFAAGLSFVMLFTIFESAAAIFAMNGQLGLAMVACKISVNIHRALSAKSADYARQLGLMADIYLMQDNLKAAEKSARKALKVYESFEDARDKAIKHSDKNAALAASLAMASHHQIIEPLCHETLASVHIKREEWQKAIDEAKFAIKKLELLNQDTPEGPIKTEGGSPEDMLMLKIAQQPKKRGLQGGQQALASSLLVLGEAYNGQSMPMEAKAVLNRALKIREEVSKDAPYRAAEVHLELAHSATLDDEPESARKHRERARELALKQPCFLSSLVLNKLGVALPKAPGKD
ncbi:MAG: hypothetical protein QG625_2753 [Cyanobacteriota bacterium erpe_2018_sw_39hr_WHONDRS-SW48-000098_B_bin.30]|nr:hypothetical protein [Cyanobacteriota bacterium erpe_2018_sw_39hr_WHONDRS-SW48-000098_B_bin.30]